MIKTYRDLLVWQKAVQFITVVYTITKGFPLEELYILTSQMRRAGISIASNIAEGYGRQSTKEYVRFLKVSRGSLCELQTQIEVAHNLNYIAPPEYNSLIEKSGEIDRMLSSLIIKVSRNPKRNV